jgi:hypothetical protein
MYTLPPIDPQTGQPMVSSLHAQSARCEEVLTDIASFTDIRHHAVL